MLLVWLGRPYCTIGSGQYTLLSGRPVQTGRVLFEFKFTTVQSDLFIFFYIHSCISIQPFFSYLFINVYQSIPFYFLIYSFMYINPFIFIFLYIHSCISIHLFLNSYIFMHVYQSISFYILIYTFMH